VTNDHLIYPVVPALKPEHGGPLLITGACPLPLFHSQIATATAIKKLSRKNDHRFFLSNQSAVFRKKSLRVFIEKSDRDYNERPRLLLSSNDVQGRGCRSDYLFTIGSRFFLEKRFAIFPAKSISVFSFQIAITIAIKNFSGKNDHGFSCAIDQRFFCRRHVREYP
jgi:hypothetical protein